MDVEDARSRLYALQGTLNQLAENDPEHRVQGVALPVLSAVLGLVDELVQRDPVLRVVVDGLQEQARSGAPVRASDALLVVVQVLEALPSQPPYRFERGYPHDLG